MQMPRYCGEIAYIIFIRASAKKDPNSQSTPRSYRSPFHQNPLPPPPPALPPPSPPPPFQEFGGKALRAAEQAEAGVSGLFGGGNVARKLGVDNGGLSLLATTTTTTTTAMGTFDVLLLMMMMLLLQLPFTVLLLVWCAGLAVV